MPKPETSTANVAILTPEGGNAAKNKRRSSIEEVLPPSKKQHKDSATTTSPTDGPQLNGQQEMIRKLVVEGGKSVFFTGSAGTGKSVVLRKIIADLKEKFKKEPNSTMAAVAVTAPTGIAACNIGGVTIHSWAGVGTAKEDITTTVNKIKKNKRHLANWLRAKVLVIDEVSMVDAYLMDMLAKIARELTNRPNDSFGGIQLVVSGDFLQLPPVTKKTVKYAFESQMWDQTIEQAFILTEVFRQKDPEFLRVLEEIRVGVASQATIDKLQSLSRPLDTKHGIKPIELYPMRKDVEARNNWLIAELKGGETMSFAAQDSIHIADKEAGEKMLEQIVALKSLELRSGAQVMLIKNVDKNMVNGTMGIVTGFVTPSDASKEELQTLPPSATTAKSRTSGRKDGTAPDTSGGTNQRQDKFPLVPETFSMEDPEGKVLVERLQIPVIPAYALSIHKAQGQTLEHVKIDLSGAFACGSVAGRNIGQASDCRQVKHM
ncbi:ATP-dependent DNA helicase PIF1 [Mycena indigotica]|uniref:ATP-dependent DNA helicase n=1 Tax=Mycena indigotica TaxID=2126181 RepID=A0A8H6VY84_9AGAR|nr:ATP-dependent DNA helicase PIF1 [Mycena indigotica]KAF7292554.1 ATP-dependent DNA helicase PIF1 [Mycena indigotica]